MLAISAGDHMVSKGNSAWFPVCNHAGDLLGQGQLDGKYIVYLCQRLFVQLEIKTSRSKKSHPLYRGACKLIHRQVEFVQLMLAHCGAMEKIERGRRKAHWVDIEIVS